MKIKKQQQKQVGGSSETVSLGCRSRGVSAQIPFFSCLSALPVYAVNVI
jgi:hypothetical protein